jgi:hypothetical protein
VRSGHRVGRRTPNCSAENAGRISLKEADVNKCSLLLAVVLLLMGAGTAMAVWVPIDAAAETPPTVVVVSNSSSGTVLDVVIHGFNKEPVTIDGMAFDRISLPGEVMADLDIGKPEMPKLSHLLGIPDSAEVTVSLDALDSLPFGGLLLYPFQGPQMEDSVYPFHYDTSFYAQDTWYPGQECELANTGIWRDFCVASILNYPMTYNPLQRQLRICRHFRVSATYIGGGYAHKAIAPWAAALYSRYMANYGSLDIEFSDPNGVQYLVLGYRHDSCPEVDSLLNWHERCGIRTRAEFRPWWTCDDIKAKIRSVYDTFPMLRWVLLIGDHDVVQPKNCEDSAKSDFWFADMQAGPDTGDWYPEVGVSRLSENDPDSIANEIRKILKYEKDPADPLNPGSPYDWLTHMSLVANRQETGGFKFPSTMRGLYSVARGLPYYEEFEVDTIIGCDPGVSNEDVRHAINQRGTGILLYHGHGLENEWVDWYGQGTGKNWTAADVEGLCNGTRTPIVYNSCCRSGNISENPCLAEDWMRDSAGRAVATIGATLSLDVDPDHGTCSTLVCVTGTDNWEIHPGYNAPTFDLGWIMGDAQAYLRAKWPKRHAARHNQERLLALGDPAMGVWSGGIPQHAAILPDRPVVAIGKDCIPLQVRVNGGNPVSNARVCAWKDNEFRLRSATDPNGVANETTFALTPGPVHVFVTGGHGFYMPHIPILPTEFILQAVPANIVFDHYVIDDQQGGDGNGEAGPGETIRLPTVLRNTAPVSANIVTVKLRLRAPDHVMLGDSVWTAGSIGANGTCNVGPFEFTIAADCPGGYLIPFRLHTADGYGNFWDSDFEIPVSAGLPTNVDFDATFPTQARHLIRRPNSEELHFVYQKPDPLGNKVVWHQKSLDGGKTWSREVLALGSSPCISLDFDGLPWVTYTRDGSLFGSACDAAGQWHEFLIYSDDNLRIGTSSFVCSNLRSSIGYTPPTDMGYVVFTTRPTNSQDDVYSLCFTAFDPVFMDSRQRHSYCITTIHDGLPAPAVDTLPCIAKTPGDWLHVCWQIGRPDDGSQDYIMYKSPQYATAPWLIRAGVMPSWSSQSPQNVLAYAYDVNSPFVDVLGLEVYAAWADQEPGPEYGCDRAEVWRKWKTIGGVWQQLPDNWSATTNYFSDYPSMSQGYLVWANDSAAEMRTKRNFTDVPANIYCSGENYVMFPHSEYQSCGQTAPGILRVLFTEGQTYTSCAVRLVKYQYPTTDGAFYTADIGGSNPSVFCMQRDGAKQYSSCDIDYDSTQLEYQLLYLNPMCHYRARLIMYHEDPSRCRTCTEVDSGVPQMLAVWPREQETLWVDIPQESYRDAKTNLSISKLTGREAVLADLTVYQYEDTNPAGSGGGAQSRGIEGPRLEPALNSASLFSDRLSISYVVPSEARISLRVLDLTGRVVRVLQDERTGLVRSGHHSVDWDGCDDLGKALPGGVYFCRLNGPNFSLGRKLVLTR